MFLKDLQMVGLIFEYLGNPISMCQEGIDTGPVLVRAVQKKTQQAL